MSIDKECIQLISIEQIRKKESDNNNERSLQVSILKKVSNTKYNIGLVSKIEPLSL
jgi:hypothetical protein